jgi:hypothetical protein
MKTAACPLCESVFIGDGEFCFDCQFALDYLASRMDIQSGIDALIIGKNVAHIRYVLQRETGRTVASSVAAVVYVLLCMERQKDFELDREGLQS